jgi:toxin FitB
MLILDTNVLSELMNPAGATVVLNWADAAARRELFTTALNQAEILYGLAIMPKGKKRTDRIAWADTMFAQDFHGRVLPFDGQAAIQYADIVASRRRIGRPIDPVDAQIAAIARVHGMSIATRDVRGFERCGIDVVNPWST